MSGQRPAEGDPALSFGPAWASNDETLAYFRRDDRTTRICVWKPATSSHVLFDEPVLARRRIPGGPEWCPSGIHVYAVIPAKTIGHPFGGSDRLDSTAALNDIGKFCLPTQSMERLSIGRRIDSMALAPDGSMLACFVGGAGAAIMGKAVHDLHLIPVDGRPSTILVRDVQRASRSREAPLWSPCSTKVAYINGASCYIVMVNDKSARRIRTPHPAREPIFGWDNSGIGVVVMTATGDVFVTDEASGNCVVRLDCRGPCIVRRHNRRHATPQVDGAFYVLNSRTTERGYLMRLSRVPSSGERADILLEADAALQVQLPPEVGPIAEMSRDGGMVAYSRQTDRQPPEVWTYDVQARRSAQFTRLSQLSAGIRLGTSIGRRPARGNGPGFRALVPPQGQRSTPFPAVVCIYPSARPSGQMKGWTALDTGILHAQLFASRGLAVVWPDFALSVGNGTLIEQLSESVLPAVESAVDAGIADPTRLALAGFSAGGHAVTVLLGMTDYFKAAIAFAAGSDRPALANRNAGERASGDPAADGSPRNLMANPLAFRADSIHTPLLLVHGVQDKTVPVAHSDRLFAQLRQAKRIVTYLRYEDEGHYAAGFSRQNHSHLARTALGWLSDWLS